MEGSTDLDASINARSQSDIDRTGEGGEKTEDVVFLEAGANGLDETKGGERLESKDHVLRGKGKMLTRMILMRSEAQTLTWVEVQGVLRVILEILMATNVRSRGRLQSCIGYVRGK